MLGGPPYYLAQPVVDEIELWLIAEMIGVNEDNGWIASLLPEVSPEPSDQELTPEEFHQMSVARNVERMRRAQAGEPPVDDDAMTIGSINTLLPPEKMSQLAVRRGRAQPGR